MTSIKLRAYKKLQKIAKVLKMDIPPLEKIGNEVYYENDEWNCDLWWANKEIKYRNERSWDFFPDDDEILTAMSEVRWYAKEGLKMQL